MNSFPDGPTTELSLPLAKWQGLVMFEGVMEVRSFL